MGMEEILSNERSPVQVSGAVSSQMTLSSITGDEI